MDLVKQMAALLKKITKSDDEIVNHETKHSDQETLLIPKPNKPKASFRMQLAACAVNLVGVLLAAVSFACVQILDGAVPEFELNAWRFGVQLVIMIPINMCRNWNLKVPKQHIPLMFFNILLVNAGNVVVFTSIIYLPVGLIDVLLTSIVIGGNVFLSIWICSTSAFTIGGNSSLSSTLGSHQ